MILFLKEGKAEVEAILKRICIKKSNRILFKKRIEIKKTIKMTIIQVEKESKRKQKPKNKEKESVNILVQVALMIKENIDI